MAKSKKNSRKKQRHQHQPKNKGPITGATAPSLEDPRATTLTLSPDAAVETAAAQVLLPLPFPAHLPRPTGDFLRNEPPHAKSYAEALQTAYEGFVVDNDITQVPETNDGTNSALSLSESAMQACLEQMQLMSYFRRDITQPFGLGTACAPTYVTRCLVGAPGTTYKYLGLRMFAHPWCKTSDSVTAAKPTQQIGALAQALTKRTRHHLQKLDVQRQKRGAPPTQYTRTSGGNNHNNNNDLATFNICLINRMDAAEKNLKDEPSMSAAPSQLTQSSSSSSSSPSSSPSAMKMKTSVSWHADSSLEQYSTIAVYQTLVPKQSQGGAKEDNLTKRKRRKEGNQDDNNATGQDSTSDNGWYVALRVAHHSEGPQASRRGTDIDSAIVKETPPIAASLQSGSTYYLLDDFNHHHQHTVLSNHNSLAAKQTIRYSCTFRLLRESHTDVDMLGRCRSAIGNFHRKGPKLWRSEQLTLTELESEWIRQFYIQGQDHYDMLTQAYWKEPLEQFLQCWSQLEGRTMQTLDLLRYAAEGKSQSQNTVSTRATSNGPPLTKSERKARDKRKKALATMVELLGRQMHIDESGDIDNDASSLMYEPIALLLEERATMRELWAKREKDHVFTALSPGCRPLTLPVEFECDNVNNGTSTVNASKGGTIATRGKSPLPGTPEKLREIAETIRALGRAFVSGKEDDLPDSIPWDIKDSLASSCDVKSGPHKSGEHSKSLDWPGWAQSDAEFGLELQQPWASAILNGEKTIETRLYNLPSALVGKRLWIIQTPAGKTGVSAMGDSVDFCTSHRASPKASASATATTEAKIIGWCTFASIKQYTDKHTFEADESSHLVSPSSGYGWQEGKTNTVYGWKVGEFRRTDKEQDSSASDIVSGTRRMRSLFQLKRAVKFDNSSGSAPQKKRSKNKKRASASRNNDSPMASNYRDDNHGPTQNKRKKRY